MANNTEIPDSWAIPDDLSKKISEALNKKSITPEDKLANALEDIARDIALIEPHPQDWGWWITHLLEQMEGEAERRIKHDDFNEMLRTLLSELTKRVDSRKW